MLIGGIDTVIARVRRGRRGDPKMDLTGSCLSQHRHEFLACGSANDRVINHDDGLTGEYVAIWVKFDLYTEISDGLLRLDEGPPHVVVSNESHFIGNLRRFGVPDSRSDTGVGNGGDEIRHDRFLDSQLSSHVLAELVDVFTEYP